MAHLIKASPEEPLVFERGKPIPQRIFEEVTKSSGKSSILPFEATGMTVSKNAYLIPDYMKKKPMKAKPLKTKKKKSKR